MPKISMIRSQRTLKSGGIASDAVVRTSEETLRNRDRRYRDLERKAAHDKRSS